jgi:hypothetical protein
MRFAPAGKIKKSRDMTISSVFVLGVRIHYKKNILHDPPRAITLSTVFLIRTETPDCSIWNQTIIINFSSTQLLLLISDLFLSKGCFGAKTFLATKNTDLSPIPFPELIDPISSIDDLVRTTILYKKNFDFPANVGALVPTVGLVRGSNVTSSATIRPSPYEFVGAALEAYTKHQNLVIRPDDIWFICECKS